MPRKAASEEVLTIEPPPDCRIAGTPCLQPRNTPSTLIDSMRRHCSTVSVSKVAGKGPEMPALLTSPLSLPSRASMSSMMRFQSASCGGVVLLEAAPLPPICCTVSSPPGAIDVGHDHRRAFGGEQLRGGAADARSRARHQHDLVRNPAHAFLP